jgi:hypothetical protein
MRKLIITSLCFSLVAASVFCSITGQAQLLHEDFSATQQPLLQKILLKQNYVPVILYRASQQNSLVCMGSLDKANDQRLLIDIGATTTNIDPKAVLKAGLKPGSKSIMVGGGDDLTPRAYELTIPTLRLGNFITHNEPSLIIDQSPKKIDKHPIIATLGMTFFRKYQSIIDINGRHLYLKSGTKKANLNTYHDMLIRMGYIAIPLIITPSGHVMLKTQVNNSRFVNMLFDSGVPFTMLSTDLAKQLKLQARPWIIGGGSGGGKIIFLKTHIKALTVESINWTPPFIGVMNFKNVRVKTTVSGVIGLDWMQAHHVIIDAANSLLFVRATPK